MGIFSSITEKVRRFIDVNINLLKVNLIGRSSVLLSYLMFGMITLFVLFCIILFFGFGMTEVFVAMGLTKLAAYFATMGFYVLLLGGVFAARKPITKYFANNFVQVMTEDGDDEEKGEKKE